MNKEDRKDLVERLRKIADASRRHDGSDIPLGSEVREAAAEIDRLRRELEEARRRTAELEAALKPFMWGDDAVCEILFGGFPDEKSMTFTIPLGDFRRARAAIRKAGEPTP